MLIIGTRHRTTIFTNQWSLNTHKGNSSAGRAPVRFAGSRWFESNLPEQCVYERRAGGVQIAENSQLDEAIVLPQSSAPVSDLWGPLFDSSGRQDFVPSTFATACWDQQPTAPTGLRQENLNCEGFLSDFPETVFPSNFGTVSSDLASGNNLLALQANNVEAMHNPFAQGWWCEPIKPREADWSLDATQFRFDLSSVTDLDHCAKFSYRLVSSESAGTSGHLNASGSTARTSDSAPRRSERQLQQGRQYNCQKEDCKKTFRSPKDLRRHQNEAHPDASVPIYICRCGYRSSRKDRHRRHLKQNSCVPVYSLYRCVCSTIRHETSRDRHMQHVEACTARNQKIGRPPRLVS